MSCRKRSQGGERTIRLLRRDARPESGFTLIELVVALLLLAILMSASLYAIMQGLGLSRDSQGRAVASNLGAQILEKLRAQALSTSGFDSIPIGTQTLNPQTIQGATYTLTQNTEWVNRGADTSECNTASAVSPVLEAQVTVGWGFSNETATDSTLLAPPNGTFSTDNGAIGVQVNSSNPGSPPYTGGALVTITNSKGQQQSITTGTDGCAFFADLAFDNYLVSVTDSGGVGTNETSTYNYPKPVTVSSGNETAQVTVQYDAAGTINWSLSPTSPTPASGMPISLDAPPSLGLTTYNMYVSSSLTGGAGTTGTISPVFPASYTAFAGGCTDADPNGQTTAQPPQPYYGTTSFAATVVSPSTTSTASVPLFPLKLAISNTSPAASTFTSTTGPSADEGETAGALQDGVVCPGTSGAPTYTLSNFGNSNGTSLSSVGLGHLDISATVKSGSSTYKGCVNIWVTPAGVYSVNTSSGLTNTTTPDLETFGTGGAYTGSVPFAVSKTSPYPGCP